MQNIPLNTKRRNLFLSIAKLFLGFVFITNSFSCQAQNRGGTQTIPPVNLRDGVVINTNKNEIYSADAQLNISAINLETGKTIWRSDTKGRPLAILKGKLIIQIQAEDNSKAIVFGELDINNKGKLTKQSNVSVPDPVRVRVKSSVDGTFFLTPYNYKENVFFEWSYLPPISGDYNEGEQQKREVGAIAFNGRRYSKVSLSSLPNEYNNRSIRATKQLQINKENTQQFISKNGKHLLVSTKDLKSSNFESYSWEIYDIATKERIGSLTSYVSYASFIVVKNTLVLEQGPYETFKSNKVKAVPLQLVGYNLKDNKTLWEKEILNPLYLGPSPP